MNMSDVKHVKVHLKHNALSIIIIIGGECNDEILTWSLEPFFSITQVCESLLNRTRYDVTQSLLKYVVSEMEDQWSEYCNNALY